MLRRAVCGLARHEEDIVGVTAILGFAVQWVGVQYAAVTKAVAVLIDKGLDAIFQLMENTPSSGRVCSSLGCEMPSWFSSIQSSNLGYTASLLSMMPSPFPPFLGLVELGEG